MKHEKINNFINIVKNALPPQRKMKKRIALHLLILKPGNLTFWHRYFTFKF
jgi:hypothetical protein